MTLKAEDLLPLVAKLPRAERVRLARFALARSIGPETDTPETDADAYAAKPPGVDEFASDDDVLAWDGDGWEGFA